MSKEAAAAEYSGEVRLISAESNLQKKILCSFLQNAQMPTERQTDLIYIFIASKEISPLRICKIYHI